MFYNFIDWCLNFGLIAWLLGTFGAAGILSGVFFGLHKTQVIEWQVRWLISPIWLTALLWIILFITFIVLLCLGLRNMH